MLHLVIAEAFCREFCLILLLPSIISAIEQFDNDTKKVNHCPRLKSKSLAWSLSHHNSSTEAAGRWIITMCDGENCRKWKQINDVSGMNQDKQVRCVEQKGFIYHQCSYPLPRTCGFRSIFNEGQQCGLPKCQCGPDLYYYNNTCVELSECRNQWLANVDGLSYYPLPEADSLALTVHLPNHKRVISLRLSKDPDGYGYYTGHDARVRGSRAGGVIIPLGAAGGFFWGHVAYPHGSRYIFDDGHFFIDATELEEFGYHSVVYTSEDLKNMPNGYEWNIDNDNNNDFHKADIFHYPNISVNPHIRAFIKKEIDKALAKISNSSRDEFLE